MKRQATPEQKARAAERRAAFRALAAKVARMSDGDIPSGASGHSVVAVKVNAWVDRGIAPLVVALNDLGGLWTVSSCEGQSGPARVHFAYVGSASEFAVLMEKLSVALGTRLGAGGDFRLALEWTAGGERPLGALVARREVVLPLAKAIQHFAASFGRRSRLRRGNRGTRPRNSTGHRHRQPLAQ